MSIGLENCVEFTIEGRIDTGEQDFEFFNFLESGGIFLHEDIGGFELSAELFS